MSEKSGIHVTGADSGWPNGSALEPPYTKDGTGSDPHPHATGVANGVVTGLQEGVLITLSGGAVGTTWTITFGGQTTSGLALNASAAAVLAALEAMSNVAPGDFTVSGGAGGPYLITALEGGAHGDVIGAFTVDPVGVNEVQTLTVDATAGTYTLEFDGEVTGDIAEAALAAAVETALEALPNIAPADVGVTGSAGGPYTITFTGALAEADIPLLVADDTDLTGGASTAVVTDATPGKTGPTVTVTVVQEGS